MDINALQRVCVELSSKAYDTHDISRKGVEVLVRYLDDTIFIAVRGTEVKSLRDILRNLEIWPTNTTKYKWHSGFWKGGECVYQQITRRIANLYTERGLYHKDTKLVFTGHSQGAGIALCLARQFELGGYNVSHCIGFGAPRSVSRIKGAQVGFTYINYKVGRDVVPTLLPLGILYKHLTKPIRMGVPSHWFPNWPDHSIRGYARYLIKKLTD